MFVESVEACRVDEAERSLTHIPELQRGVAHDNTAARVEHTEDGAEMNAVLLVPDGMSQHGQLVLAGLHAVGHLRGEPEVDVD